MSSDRSDRARQFDQDLHVEEESFDGPVGDPSSAVLEGIERPPDTRAGAAGQVNPIAMAGWGSPRLQRRIRPARPREPEATARTRRAGGEVPARAGARCPDLTLGSEADHLVATEVDESHHFRTGPGVRDGTPKPEPGGIPHAPPCVADFEWSERSSTASWAAIGSPCRWWADTSSGARRP